MSDGGKGDSPRPFSVTQSEFDSNWDRIFKRKQHGGSTVDQPIDSLDNTGGDFYGDILSTEDCFSSSEIFKHGAPNAK